MPKMARNVSVYLAVKLTMVFGGVIWLENECEEIFSKTKVVKTGGRAFGASTVPRW